MRPAMAMILDTVEPERKVLLQHSYISFAHKFHSFTKLPLEILSIS